MSFICDVCRPLSSLSKLEDSFLAENESEAVSEKGKGLWRKISAFINFPKTDRKQFSGFHRKNMRTMRLVVEKFLQSKDYEKVRELFPFFSVESLPKASSRFKNADVVMTYCKIHALSCHVFTALPEGERGVLRGVSAEEAATSPEHFLRLLQTSYQYSIGLLSQDGEGGKSSRVERGALIKNILSLHLPFKFPEALLLAQSHLACLPAEIKEWSKTKILDLCGNALHCIPGEIGTLQHLTQLNLSKNKLHFLPKEIGALQSLQMIDLSFNPLEKFPKELKSLKNIRSITLDEKQKKKFSRAIARFLVKRKDCKIERTT